MIQFDSTGLKYLQLLFSKFCITVIMVTHDMGVVRHLCKRVIQIEHGVSLPELPLEESLKRYQKS